MASLVSDPSAAADVVDAAVCSDSPVSQQTAWTLVRRCPSPDWITAVSPGTIEDHDQPIEWLLYDEQSRFAGVPERYRRTVRRAVNDLGVDWLAEQRIEFNPSYQKIVLHHLQIKRGDALLDVMDDVEQDLVRSEPDMQMRVYCGAYVLITQIRALEPGDTLDFAYTIVGQNPALSCHAVEHFGFASIVDIGRRHARALVSSSIPITAHRVGNPPDPQVSTREGIKEWCFEVTGLRRRAFEDAVPAELDDQGDTFTLTSFGSWADVASWAAEFYSFDKDEPALGALAERFRADEPNTPELAAIEYVQEAVRYVAANFGEGGIRPRALATICRRRYGDCKDKSVLLAALLRSLRHRSDVALVNTVDPFAPLARAPAPDAFNHLIVRAEIDGELYWIDPTVNGQVSPLKVRGRPHDMVALVINAATTELVQIPPLGDEHFGEITHTVHDLTGGPGSAVTLTYESKYIGESAEAVRRYIRAYGVEERARQLLDWESTILGPAERVGAFDLEDDEELNILTTRTTIRFEQPWIARPDGGLSYRYPLCQVNELLPQIVGGKRRLPVSISVHPFRHIHREDFVFSEECIPCGFEQDRRSARNQAFSASRTASLEGNRYVVIAHTQTHSHYVEAKEAAAAKRDKALLRILNLVELDYPVHTSS